jgi:hypothetical protein
MTFTTSSASWEVVMIAPTLLAATIAITPIPVATPMIPAMA